MRAGGRTVVLFTDEQAAAVVRAISFIFSGDEPPLTVTECEALLTVRQALSMTTEKKG